jgi:hypothetical protein
MQRPKGTITISRMPTKIVEFGDNSEGTAMMDNEVEVVDESSSVLNPKRKKNHMMLAIWTSCQNRTPMKRMEQTQT